MRLSDAEHMREADRIAIQERNVPSAALMRTAARHLAQAALEQMGTNRRAVLFCGSGNNGGDGVAAAEYLLEQGASCRVFLVGSRARMTGDTQEMERGLLAAGGRLEDFDPEDPELPGLLSGAGVIVDAIFGVGLNRPLRDKALQAVRLINAAAAPVIAADIPSGVSADTGQVLGEAVHADMTVTFSMAKIGHFAEPGCVCAGDVRVCGIGLPEELLERAATAVEAATRADVRLPRRPRISHKGDYGKLLIVGGSVGYTGAPSLCSNAAMRSGAGLVYLGVPADIYPVSAVKNDGAMPFPLPGDGTGKLAASAEHAILEKLETCGTLVIGPGLGRSEALTMLVRDLLEQTAATTVIDADALFAVAQDVSILRRMKRTPVLTPHEGEFARLFPQKTGVRLEDARTFARENQCILVLKGHRTITAFPDGTAWINTTGNPGMAKGGSGDVLAGMIGALLGQLPAKQAVTTAVWLHGRAGDLCAARLGEYGMTPMDLVHAIPEATLEIVT